MPDYKIDYRNVIEDGGELPEYITIFEDNKPPTWYKITHDDDGAYVEFRGEKLYVYITE